MSAPSPALVFLMVLSPAIGSFLTVLIDRLPRGQSIVLPGSACRSCATRLGLRDLVPVVSFALSGGRCRHCGTPVPPFHLYVEITAIAAALFAVILSGGQAQTAWGIAVILWILLALAVSDLLWMRLPNPLTAALAVAAFGWHITQPAGTLGLALIGAGLGSGVFLALRLGYHRVRGREGLGMGDVKLMAGLGALIGPFDLPLMVLLAALGALAAALVHGFAHKHALRSTSALPFGTALCTAGVLLWLLRLSGG